MAQHPEDDNPPPPPIPPPLTPPPPTPPSPPRFNLVNCLGEITNTRLPIIKDALTNPNNNVYFWYSLTGYRILVSAEEIRNYFRDPLGETPWQFRGLLMETPDGSVYPAHVPSIMDLDRFCPVTKLVLSYLLEQMDESEDSPIVPDAWASLLDPEPTVRDYGRIFLLNNNCTLLSTAHNTDQIDVFWVSHYMTLIKMSMWSRWADVADVGRRFLNTIRIGGGICEECDAITMHSSFIVWNVRGVNRLGFAERFKQVVLTHNPVMVVLMETRASKLQMREVVKGLVGGYKYEIVNTRGMFAGFAVLWNVTLLKIHSRMVETAHGSSLNCMAEVNDGSVANGLDSLYYYN